MLRHPVMDIGKNFRNAVVALSGRSGIRVFDAVIFAAVHGVFAGDKVRVFTEDFGEPYPRFRFGAEQVHIVEFSAMIGILSPKKI